MIDGCDDIERAFIRVQAENEAAIMTARSALAHAGSRICLDCGCDIEAERRAALPSAKRCIECQTFMEAEKYHK